MKRIRKIFRKLVEWLKPSYKIEFIDEVPESLNKRTVYIIGNTEEPWLLYFQCPCGCKSPIQLNLLSQARPRWEFTVNQNKEINIIPSVWKINGCNSHFIIRKSKVRWC